MASVFTKAKFLSNGRVLALALAMLVLPAVAETVTITWIGPESGGNWSEAANWDKSPITWPKSGSQPSDVPVWDFSKLTDGATVVNDYNQSAEYLYVGGFVFGENAGRITLSGGATSETVFAKGNSHVVSIVAPVPSSCRRRRKSASRTSRQPAPTRLSTPGCSAPLTISPAGRCAVLTARLWRRTNGAAHSRRLAARFS